MCQYQWALFVACWVSMFCTSYPCGGIRRWDPLWQLGWSRTGRGELPHGFLWFPWSYLSKRGDPYWRSLGHEIRSTFVNFAGKSWDLLMLKYPWWSTIAPRWTGPQPKAPVKKVVIKPLPTYLIYKYLCLVIWSMRCNGSRSVLKVSYHLLQTFFFCWVSLETHSWTPPLFCAFANLQVIPANCFSDAWMATWPVLVAPVNSRMDILCPIPLAWSHSHPTAPCPSSPWPPWRPASRRWCCCCASRPGSCGTGPSNGRPWRRRWRLRWVTSAKVAKVAKVVRAVKGDPPSTRCCPSRAHVLGIQYLIPPQQPQVRPKPKRMVLSLWWICPWNSHSTGQQRKAFTFFQILIELVKCNLDMAEHVICFGSEDALMERFLQVPNPIYLLESSTSRILTDSQVYSWRMRRRWREREIAGEWTWKTILFNIHLADMETQIMAVVRHLLSYPRANSWQALIMDESLHLDYGWFG